MHRVFNGENVSVTGQDVIEYFDKLLAESDQPSRIALAMARVMAPGAPAAGAAAAGAPAAGAAGAAAAGGAAAGDAAVGEKRKPIFSPAK